MQADWKLCLFHTSFYTGVLNWFIYMSFIYKLFMILLYHVPDQMKLCNRAAWENSCITECYNPV